MKCSASLFAFAWVGELACCTKPHRITPSPTQALAKTQKIKPPLAEFSAHGLASFRLRAVRVDHQYRTILCIFPARLGLLPAPDRHNWRAFLSRPAVDHPTFWRCHETAVAGAGRSECLPIRVGFSFFPPEIHLRAITNVRERLGGRFRWRVASSLPEWQEGAAIGSPEPGICGGSVHNRPEPPTVRKSQPRTHLGERR